MRGFTVPLRKLCLFIQTECTLSPGFAAPQVRGNNHWSTSEVQL
jgi:hypothetical protein